MPLLLDRKAYEAQISVAFGMVQEMPYDELSHRGKRFLWPWEWGWRMPAREKGSSGHHCACGIPPLARRLLTAQRALNQEACEGVATLGPRRGRSTPETA